MTIFLHGRFLFKVLLMGGVRWVGILDAIVEETVLVRLCFINVCFYVSAVFFFFVSCFLILLPASPGPTHNMI